MFLSSKMSWIFIICVATETPIFKLEMIKCLIVIAQGMTFSLKRCSKHQVKGTDLAIFYRGSSVSWRVLDACKALY